MPGYWLTNASGSNASQATGVVHGHDRTSVLVKPKDLCRYLVAFANAEGGVIVVGIQDGVVQGISSYPSHVNALRQAPLDCTQPPVRASFTQIDCANTAGVPDQLLVIRVEPGKRGS